MIHKLLVKIATFLGMFFTKLLHLNIFFRFYNFIYEHSSYAIIRIFVKFIGLPDKDNNWTIFLPNGKKVLTKIQKGNLKTRQFALSYKWHSPSINFTEQMLNQFYGKNIPWIDLGANLGLRSLLTLSENKQVFFIEPNRELNEINKERCELNNFRNYTFLEIGASNKTGELEFVIDNSSYCSTIETNVVDERNIERIEKIKINTLDNLFKDKFSSFNTAYIKIDVEGHELKVIEGAKEFISVLSPTMIIEVNTKTSHFLEFQKILEPYNYQIYEIYNFGSKKYFKLINESQKANNQVLKSNDFLCVKDKQLIDTINKFAVDN